MNGNQLVSKSESKMVTDDVWNTLYKQAAELIKSGFLPSAIKTPAQAVAVILTGRELGVGMMETLRGIHIIDNRPSISPQLMMSLIYNSGVAENIKIESTPTYCSVSGNRKGQPPITVKFTEEDAKNLSLLWKDNWKKQKQNMLRWRAISAWARLACPDVIGGLYTPEELDDVDDVVGKGEVTLALSEKLNTDPDEYDKFREQTLSTIMDSINATTTSEQLGALKRDCDKEIGLLNDQDRAYILERFDSQLQSLVSDTKNVESPQPGPTPQEMKTEHDPDAELKAREAFGQDFLKKVVAEIAFCHTKAQLMVFKNKNIESRSQLLPDAREYFDAMLKDAFNKIKI